MYVRRMHVAQAEVHGTQNPDGVIDRGVDMIRFDLLSGETMASILSVAYQPLLSESVCAHQTTDC